MGLPGDHIRRHQKITGSEVQGSTIITKELRRAALGKNPFDEAYRLPFPQVRKFPHKTPIEACLLQKVYHNQRVTAPYREEVIIDS